MGRRFLELRGWCVPRRVETAVLMVGVAFACVTSIHVSNSQHSRHTRSLLVQFLFFYLLPSHLLSFLFLSHLILTSLCIASLFISLADPLPPPPHRSQSALGGVEAADATAQQWRDAAAESELELRRLARELEQVYLCALSFQ